MQIASVILAAGASQRMGRPKGRLTWRGRTFVDHVCGLASGAGCHPVVLVWGATPYEVPAGVLAVENHSWAQGQLSSLQTGIRCLGAQADALAGLLVLTVDRPRVRPDTIDALLGAFTREPKGIWQPRHEGKSGHPILYPVDLLAPLLALSASASPRELVRSDSNATRRRGLEVQDPGVVENIDTPQDLDRLGL